MAETVVVVKNQPCPAPGCGSSDALQIYSDGHAHCYSCGAHFRRLADSLVTAKAPAGDARFNRAIPRKVSAEVIDRVAGYPVRGFKSRGITRLVCAFYKVTCKPEVGDITDHYYPYSAGGYKHRTVETKGFEWVGKSGGLFGRHLFNGDGKRVVITEGEIDALSVAQMWQDVHNRIYPVVSISSAVATKDLIAERVWLRSFDEVCLCFDMDEAGAEATLKATKIIGWDKVKVVRLPLKDANEVLVKLGFTELHRCILDAERVVPAGIVSGESIWTQMRELANVPTLTYPPCLAGLNIKLKGMRKGEISLFTSGTGAGKSTVMKEIVLHILATTTSNVGIVSLEESPAETGNVLSHMAINKNSNESAVSEDELREGFDAVFANDRVMLLDHAGAINDESIIDAITFMSLSGCEYIIIDHITILISEGADGFTGNEAADRVMNSLLKFVKSNDVWLGVVSHLRKTQSSTTSFEEGRMPTIDDIRGSGSIKQVSFDVIAFARNLVAEDLTEQCIIKMRVLKCRRTGLTGDVPGAIYDRDTGRLRYLGNSATAGSDTFDTNLITTTMEGETF
jgi:twinkle protein